MSNSESNPDSSATVTEIRSRGRRPGIYILPSLFTTAGLFAGFYAIVAAMHGKFEQAAVAVFLAVRWIRGFLNSLRSPAGLAKLTDDDYERGHNQEDLATPEDILVIERPRHLTRRPRGAGLSCQGCPPGTSGHVSNGQSR